MSEFVKKIEEIEREFREKNKLSHLAYMLLNEVAELKEENRRLKIALAKLLKECGAEKPKELEGIDLSVEAEEVKPKSWVDVDRRMNAVRTVVLNTVNQLFKLYRRPLKAEEIVQAVIDRYSRVFGRRKAIELSLKWDFRRRLYELAEQGKVRRVGRNLFLPCEVKEKIGLEKYFK